MEKKKPGRIPGKALETKMNRKTDEYFALCLERGELPTMGGLALALGYPCREEMERDRLARRENREDPAGRALTRARALVEEANLQAVYRRETSAGAKFILQSEFGYDDRGDREFSGIIEVKVEPEPEREEEAYGDKNSAEGL